MFCNTVLLRTIGCRIFTSNAAFPEKFAEIFRLEFDEASSTDSLAKDFLRAASVRIALVTLEYLMTVVEALHTIVTKVSQEGNYS